MGEIKAERTNETQGGSYRQRERERLLTPQTRRRPDLLAQLVERESADDRAGFSRGGGDAVGEGFVAGWEDCGEGDG